MNSYDLLVQFLVILAVLGGLCFGVLFYWLKSQSQVQLPMVSDRRQLNIEVAEERRKSDRRKRARNQVYLGWQT